MAQGKAEDAGGLTPAKDGSAALCHFDHRTLPIFKCVGYIPQTYNRQSGCFFGQVKIEAAPLSSGQRGSGCFITTRAAGTHELPAIPCPSPSSGE